MTSKGGENNKVAHQPMRGFSLRQRYKHKETDKNILFFLCFCLCLYVKWERAAGGGTKHKQSLRVRHLEIYILYKSGYGTENKAIQLSILRMSTCFCFCPGRPDHRVTSICACACIRVNNRPYFIYWTSLREHGIYLHPAPLYPVGILPYKKGCSSYPSGIKKSCFGASKGGPASNSSQQELFWYPAAGYQAQKHNDRRLSEDWGLEISVRVWITRFQQYLPLYSSDGKLRCQWTYWNSCIYH